MTKRWLVTGAAGFVGSAVVAALQREGAEVVALARRLPSEARSAPGLRWIGADLADSEDLAGHLEGIDGVVHAAARVGAHGRRGRYVRDNVTATRRLLAAAAAAPVKRFVHISTIDVYGRLGPRESGSVSEDEPLPGSLRADPYAETKWLAERALWSAAGPFERVAVRPAWVYGAGDRVSLPDLVESVRRQRLVWIGGDDHFLQLVHVRDLARAVAAVALAHGGLERTYNAVGEVVPVRTFVETLCRAAGARVPTQCVSARVLFGLGYACERLWDLGLPGKPPVTRHAVRVLGPQPIFRSERLATLLGDWPRERMEQVLPEAVEWLARTRRTPHGPSESHDDEPDG